MNSESANITHKLKIHSEESFKFISLISHEIKHSFNSIIAINNIILRDNIIDNPDLKELILLIQARAHKSFDLLENLIHLYNQPFQAIQEQKRLLDVNNSVRSIIDFFRFQIEQKRLSIVLNIGSNFRIKTSEDFFSFIFRNLLSNSIKCSDIGGKVEVGYSQNNEVFEFSVRDYGIGLSDLRIKEILSDENPVNQFINNSISSDIGLQLCYHYVKRFGGKMEISSEKGEGSKIIVKLPC